VLLTLLPANEQLRVSDNAFRVALGLRLGVSTPAMFGNPLLVRACGPNAAANNQLTSVFHSISCNYRRGPDTLTARHNRIRDLFCNFLSHAGAACIPEPVQVVTEHNRRADIAIRLDGQRFVVDVSIRSPYVEKDLARTYDSPLGACAKAESDKGYLYRQMYKDYNAEFLTLAFEVSGAYGKETTEFFGHVRKFLQSSFRNQFFPKSYVCRTYLKYFQQLIAVALAEENARIALVCVNSARNRAQQIGNVQRGGLDSNSDDETATTMTIDNESSTSTTMSASNTSATDSSSSSSSSDDDDDCSDDY
jgi:hypothetical protein